MEFLVEAPTLTEAEGLIAARAPAGAFVVFREVQSDGRAVTLIAREPTTEEAYAKAEAMIPAGAAVISRRETGWARTRAVEIEAPSEAEARANAHGSAKSGASVRSCALIQKAAAGFLGAGAKPARWRVEIDEPAEVEIVCQAPARVFIRTAGRPQSWESLIAAMSAASDPALAKRLEEAWPHQTQFLLLTDAARAPGFFKDVPFSLISQHVVEAARGYVERRKAPGMLGVAGEGLDPDRYRPTGGARIGRLNNPVVDCAIVTTASCLPRENINALDYEHLARRAFEAIQHYAAIPVARFCFSLPHLDGALRTREIDLLAAQIDVYKGVEALLLEIWDELGHGEVITDAHVVRKARAVLAS